MEISPQQTEAVTISSNKRRHASAQRTMHGDERYQELILAAYNLIAEKGVGGLRIHEVANRVGVNNATLHYYFPTKDALLRAVAEQLGRDFTNSPAPDPLATAAENTPTQKIKNYFKSLAYQLRTTPDRFIVIDELFLAARRDKQLAQVLQIDTSWQAYLTTILAEGVQQGVFRSELDIAQIALTIIAFCKGLPLLESQSNDHEKTIAQFEQWFFSIVSPSV